MQIETWEPFEFAWMNIEKGVCVGNEELTIDREPGAGTAWFSRASNFSGETVNHRWFVIRRQSSARGYEGNNCF